MFSFDSAAQTRTNNSSDSIIGDYESIQADDSYKVRISKNSNGTFKAQIFLLDKNGKLKVKGNFGPFSDTAYWTTN